MYKRVVLNTSQSVRHRPFVKTHRLVAKATIQTIQICGRAHYSINAVEICMTEALLRGKENIPVDKMSNSEHLKIM